MGLARLILLSSVVLAGCHESHVVTKMRKQCAAEDIRACFDLAKAFAEGVVSEKNMEEAVRFRKHAMKLGARDCDGGDAEACHLMGARTFIGTPDGMKPDRKRAHKLFARGCAGGSSRACAMMRALADPEIRARIETAADTDSTVSILSR